MKDLRAIVDLTQEEMAHAAGTTLGNYQKWEAGRVAPSAKYLLQAIRYVHDSVGK